MRYFYLLFLSVIISAFAGCTSAPPVEDISEISLLASNWLGGSSLSITLRADGTARCNCGFYYLREGDKPKNENPDALCGELYRNNTSDFVKNGASIKNGVSKGASLDGTFSGDISKEQFERLAQLVHKNGFFDLKDDYNDLTVHDVSPTLTTVIYGGKTKAVSDNIGKGGEKLSEIKATIYKTAQETKWQVERK